ncbi:unnamed protein product [Fusarium venenatum]|uniref:Uncharacterized protein n=1 Tax=Fusarium venenatum TaxID=56646 RepID=A0A2L2T178_9HYPO|nr:uncharacterized protein FVRRES_00824 [Fusarium venenatum]CEI64312.1 unnamed protein product [Fusarium venenatum]
MANVIVGWENATTALCGMKAKAQFLKERSERDCAWQVEVAESAQSGVCVRRSEKAAQIEKAVQENGRGKLKKRGARVVYLAWARTEEKGSDAAI